MTTRDCEIVFEPKYLRESDNSIDYFQNVELPEREKQAVEAWESKMSQSD